MKARQLNLTLRVGHGLKLRIVERPALALTPDALAQLVADVRSVASAALPEGELDYGVLSGDRARLENAVITVVYEARTGRPVAFNALALIDAELEGRPIEILHLGLVMVDPTLRKCGLSELLYGLTCVLLFARRLGRPLRLSSVTQAPAVVGMVAETFDDVFPTPERPTDPNPSHRSLARQIMARHRSVFGVGDDAWLDEERSIIRNAYTGGSDDLKKTFEAAPKHRKSTYNSFCENGLDYARGDDFLQIAQINMRTVGRHLFGFTARRPSGALPLLALRSAGAAAVRWLRDEQSRRGLPRSEPARR